MPYPPQLVQPMRDELTRLGVEELVDAASVDEVMSDADGKNILLVVNSVCGCAAANARPAVALASSYPVGPDRLVSVFAGQDLEATARMREYLPGIPPSSPFIALFVDGDPAFVLERRHIEGRSANAIAIDLARAYQTFCSGSENGQTIQEESQPGKTTQNTFRSIL